MKIRTWIKYEESYLPPRCRKLRYRECEDYVNVNLREVNGSELQLAFEDNSYEGKGKIYFYKGKLWYKAKMPNINIVDDLRKRENKIDTPLDYLVWCHGNCSTYFAHSFDRERYGVDTSRDSVIKKIKTDLKNYILVDGVLYNRTPIPCYKIVTFGLGNNHGGTGMLCAYSYNPNISRKSYFSALEGTEAVAYANEVAKRRGDTKDVGNFKAFIVCHMPELVKKKKSR